MRVLYAASHASADSVHAIEAAPNAPSVSAMQAGSVRRYMPATQRTDRRPATAPRLPDATAEFCRRPRRYRLSYARPRRVCRAQQHVFPPVAPAQQPYNRGENEEKKIRCRLK